MSFSPPDPLALFSLKPFNDRAREAVLHSDNHHRVSRLDDGTLALDVGFHIGSKSYDNTLATLGRGGVKSTDIYIGGSSISRLQCSFEIDLDTKVVMLYDRSHAGTTQVWGENAIPFEQGRQRKVIVQDNLNTILGMGGAGRNLVQFELKWHQNPIQTAEKIKGREPVARAQRCDPRLARTQDEDTPEEPSSGRTTRPHVPRQLKMRYVTIGDMLGSGQFGAVYKAIDADSGKLMAVKILKQPRSSSAQQQWKVSLYYSLKREVEILSEVNHPYIVDYVASQGWHGPQVEIFMGLKEGTLESLLDLLDTNGTKENCSISIANLVFPQMLQALDCLASRDIIHRDVKPANILYTTQPDNQYQFQLGDFGLCNRVANAGTVVGTCIYMAPEIIEQQPQSPKADVWSLFVTMLWTLNTGGFRQMATRFKDSQDVQNAIIRAASISSVSKIREMAVIDPESRASAAQMLAKCCNGVGLSTPQDKIPDLPILPPPSLAVDLDTRAAAMAGGYLRRLWGSGSKTLVGSQNRVTKIRGRSQAQARRISESHIRRY